MINTLFDSAEKTAKLRKENAEVNFYCDNSFIRAFAPYCAL